MSVNYDHRSVEQKWQKVWLETKVDVTDISGAKKPYYNLMMFPYPSAEGLHVGNMYAFTGSDIYGRFKRMEGYEVFEPIGLDGFGIHSENYAFKVGRHPVEQAKISQDNFYRQLHLIGCMYDWERTLETYDPDYYRWTQWLFVQMFKHGLAYRAKAQVNWCPSCKTVLADEQVIDGKCERCGNLVDNKLLEQWFFRITAYAGKLLKNLEKLDWSTKVKIAQSNWIGEKSGINISYPVVDEAGKTIGTLTCFTTRPDTNFGATFVVLAPEHPFVNQILQVIEKKQADTIRRYIAKAQKTSSNERIAAGRKKTGVPANLFCVNQLNGYRMPLYVSDFVLMEVGTGAVVGVPGHDRRDFEFAVAMKLPVVRVVVGPDGDTSPITKARQVQEEEGKMVNSEFLNGMDIQKAIGVMMDYLEEKGWGKRVTTYHLRDWLISRQRYWGPPIPMIYCEKCAKEGKSWFTSEESRAYRGSRPLDYSGYAGWYPVPEDQLPVELPYIDDYKPAGDGVPPLARHKEFYETTCPGCGGKAVRETEVSDTFLDSSWYFLRYPSFHNAKCRMPNDESIQHSDLPFDPAITKAWLPVHMYTGGAEHSVLHLMYSRFITMALADMGYLDFDEPFSRFFAHGLVIKEGAKMSKSKGNVVNPDEYIKLYGVDSLRLYLMFMGPFSQGGDFRDSAMEGMSRWVGRIWRLAMASMQGSTLHTDLSRLNLVKRALHKLVKKVTEDTEKRRYNTAIAAMMEFTNLVTGTGSGLKKPQGQTPAKGLTPLDRDSLKTFVLLLAPYAPHLAEELWQRIGAEARPFQSVHRETWPAYDPKLIEEETVDMVVQVDGKLRDTLKMSNVKCQMSNEVEKEARQSQKVKKYLAGQRVKKVIFIAGKLINFVV